MTLPSVLLLLFAVFSSAGGQIMLKHGMKGAAAAAGRDGGSVALRAAGSPGSCSGCWSSRSPRSPG